MDDQMDQFKDSEFHLKTEDTCLDTHLNNPLHNLGVQQAIDDQKLRVKDNWGFNRKALWFEMRKLCRGLSISPAALTLNPQVLLPYIFNCGFTDAPEESNYLNFMKHLKVAVTLTDLTGHKFVPQQVIEVLHNIPAMLKTDVNYQQLQSLYNMRCRLEQGVVLTSKPGKYKLSRDLGSMSPWKQTFGPNGQNRFFFSAMITSTLKVYLSPRLALFSCKKTNQLWVGSRDHYLMIVDSISQRWVALFSSLLARDLKKANYPSWDELLTTFGWGDSLLELFGVEAYKSIKLWEPMIHGVLMSQHEDEIVDSTAFLRNMETELQDDGSNQGLLAASNWNRLKLSTLTKMNDHKLSQLHGLYRIWGHPSIDVIEGLQRLRSVACSNRVFSYLAIKHHKITWREMFCISYYEKNHRWPAIEILPTMPEDSLVRRCLEQGLPLPRNARSYVKDHWEYIRFKQLFAVPKKFQLNDMIKDSATSLGLTQLIESIRRGGIGSSAERSVIYQWLQNDWVDPELLLKKIDREGFDPNEKVCGLREKEKEISIYGRFFGMLPIEKRLYVVVTEAMLAEHLLPYFPEITMTFNQVQLRNLIQKETRKLRVHSDEILTTVTNMDFVKWNSNMREQETSHLFQDFDHMFGFENVFSRSYEMFSESQLYLANGYVLPEIDETKNRLKDGLTVWSDHKGGIEGLRQKGWTIFTIVALKYVASVNGISCNLMGQGDNQVMILNYKKNTTEPPRIKHQEFLRTLDQFLSLIGPPLKPEETWTSSNFFAYGKFPVLKGEPLSQSLKKIIKTTRMTNEGLQNLSSTLSSITANASAATEADTCPVIPYMIAAFESSCAIELHTRHPFFSNHSLMHSELTRHFRVPVQGQSELFDVELDPRVRDNLQKMNQEGLLSLLLVPSSLGGFPVCHYWSLIIHGFPDQLSLDLRGLMDAHIRSTNQFIKKILNRVLQPPLSPEVNPEMLCQDPNSLNLLHPSTSMDKVKGMVQSFLIERGKEISRNQAFISFLELATEDQSQLATILFSANVIHPRIMSSITESTIVGKVNQALSKINRTGVLIRLMKAAHEEDRQVVYDDLDTTGGDMLDQFKSGSPSFFDLFGRFEQNFFNCLLHTISRHEEDQNHCVLVNPCSHKYAKKLRRDSWGKDLEGVSVAVPWELLSRHVSSNANCDIDNHPNKESGYVVTNVVGLSGHNSVARPGLPPTLGPYTSYLGSGTANKVEYEAKRLIEVAPPLIRNALQLLQLIGWATPRGSNLANLILLVCKSLTDLPVEFLTPEFAQIAGTVGHRWDDIKTSRMCTASILWTGGTFISSNTNNFKPEMCLVDSVTDNLEIHFQSIFLSISHLLSVESLYKGHPVDNQCYHYHIHCKGCVESLDETLIEIEADLEEVAKLSFLTPKTENPYLWVSKENLPNLLQIGGTFGKRQEINRDTHPESLHDMLIQTACNDMMNHHSLPSPSYKSDFDIRKLYQLPLVILLKINVIPFLVELVCNLVLRMSWIHAHNLHRGSSTQSTWLKAIQDMISRILPGWYQPLFPLLTNTEHVLTIKRMWPQVNAPVGSPPSPVQKATFFSEVFKRIVLNHSFPRLYIGWLEGSWRNRKITLIKTGITNHPISKWTLAQVLKGNPDARYWYFFHHLRQLNMESDDFLIRSNSCILDVVKLNERENGATMSLVTSFVTSRYFRKAKPLTFSQANHYGVSALLSSRVRPHTLQAAEATSQEEGDFAVEIAKVKALPHSCEELLEVRSVGHYQPSQVIKEVPRHLTFEPSIINHLYKPAGTVTTATYKMVSILNLALEKDWTLPTYLDDPFFGVGDGEGGFCACLSKIWGQLKFVYNSMHKLEEFTTTGSECHTPAALYSCEGALTKVLGLQLIEEGISDLTDPHTIDVLAKNFGQGSLLTCDCEGAGQNNPVKELKIRENLTKLSRAVGFRSAIIKTYASSLDLLYNGVNQWLEIFGSVRILRTVFSGVGNTEVYLFLSNKHPEPLWPVKVIWDDEDKRLQRSRTYANISYSDFCKTMYHHAPKFLRGCREPSPSYTMYLSDKPMRDSWISDLLSFVERFSIKGVFNFPMTYLESVRRSYAPVKLHRGHPATWQISYFTPKIRNGLIRDFFIAYGISLMIDDAPEFYWLQFVELMAKVELVCFQSMDGGWSLYPLVPETRKWYRFSALVRIENEDFSLASRKSVLTILGRFRRVFKQLRMIEFKSPRSFDFPRWIYQAIPTPIPYCDQPFPIRGDATNTLPWKFRPIPLFVDDMENTRNLLEILSRSKFPLENEPPHVKCVYQRILAGKLPGFETD
uniref:RNA-directed RNA polymerase n=5 Tax=root TaxID=1 RepID=A0A5C1K3P0_9RHAB|nr:RNA-dependent RNA polymerase [Guadeloupe Culex rhabdovirus]QEM39110.1 RNA-dependent RNA polymerase [Guadeloupe Culex rhabdovirus]